MKTVIPVILNRVRLSPASEQPEGIRRRAVTFAPEHEAQVIVRERRPRPSPDAGRIPASV
jgi:hypothetical protein